MLRNSNELLYLICLITAFTVFGCSRIDHKNVTNCVAKAKSYYVVQRLSGEEFHLDIRSLKSNAIRKFSNVYGVLSHDNTYILMCPIGAGVHTYGRMGASILNLKNFSVKSLIFKDVPYEPKCLISASNDHVLVYDTSEWNSKGYIFSRNGDLIKIISGTLKDFLKKNRAFAFKESANFGGASAKPSNYSACNSL